MIIYISASIISIVILLILTVIFRKGFPNDFELKEKKNNFRNEMYKILNFGSDSEKKNLFNRIYKDSDSWDAYFMSKWINYTGQFDDFDKYNTEWDKRFREYIYPTFLKWNEKEIQVFTNKYIKCKYESKLNRNTIVYFILIFINLEVILYFAYIIVRNLMISDALYASVYNDLAPLLFISLISISLCVFIFVFFIHKKLLESKIGISYLKKSDQYNLNTKVIKISLVFFVLIVTIMGFVTVLFASYNTKILDDGLYDSEFLSLEYKHYNWDEIERFYYSYTVRFNEEDVDNIYLKTNDGKEICILGQNNFELKNRNSELVIFIKNKTGLNLEKKS